MKSPQRRKIIRRASTWARFCRSRLLAIDHRYSFDFSTRIPALNTPNSGASSGCPAKGAIVRSRRPWRYFPSAISTASSASRMSVCPPFKIFDVRISSPSYGYSISTTDDWNDSSSYRGPFPTTVPSIYESGKSDGLFEDSGSSESERGDSVWAIYCFA